MRTSREDHPCYVDLEPDPDLEPELLEDGIPVDFVMVALDAAEITLDLEGACPDDWSRLPESIENQGLRLAHRI